MKIRHDYCLLLLGPFLLLQGCLVGPNYSPPQPCIPDAWEGQAVCSDAPPCLEWWKQFQDPLLDKYIAAAATYNNTLLEAGANIFAARALRQMVASRLFPQINADVNATRTYFSKNGPVFALGMAGSNMNTGLPFTLQIPQTQNLYNAFLDASWEIDLFGKVRRAVEAADALVEGAIENRNGVLLTILGEVALNYMELRKAQEQGVLVSENIALAEKKAAVVRAQVHSGYRNGLDMAGIEAQLAADQATLPSILAQIYKNIYTLSVLTGHLPEKLLEELLPHAPLPQLPCSVALGLRSDLLRRRPDIRAAERELAAATAAIGVAVASFFPSITLSADLGLQSLHLSNLFSLRSNTWAVGGDINAPIFQGGRLVGTLRLTEAAAAAALFNYQQTVLQAVQETEGDLMAYTQDVATVHLLEEVVERTQEGAQLTCARYAQGLVGVLDVVDSDTQLNTAEQNLLTGRLTALTDLIALYKALGGGWCVE